MERVEVSQHYSNNLRETVEISPNKKNVFTAERRANEQLLLMDSFKLNGASGQYDPTLGIRQHDLGPMPLFAGDRFRKGIELFYVSYHKPEETRLRFGNNTVRPESGFLAITYVAPVQKDNAFVERFVIRVDCLTPTQTVRVVSELMNLDAARGIEEGGGIYSCTKDFDPFDSNNYLVKAIKNVVGEENLNEEHQKLIATLERQTEARLGTHNPEKNQFVLKPVFNKELGKFVVFDQVLNEFVLWEEVTSDAKSLLFINESQRLTGAYLKDPNPNKPPLRISFAVALSARTAGFRPLPSGAESVLTIDPTGIASQTTNIRNLAEIDPRFLEGPVSNWTPENMINVIPPFVTNYATPYLPFGSFGSSTSSFFGSVVSVSNISAGVQTTTSEVGALAMVFMTPAVVDMALFTTSAVVSLSSTTIVSGDDAASIATETSGGTTVVREKMVISDAIAEPLRDTSFDKEQNIFFDLSGSPNTPILPIDGGGGGRSLPVSLETKWDRQMPERFQAVRQPKPAAAENAGEITLRRCDKGDIFVAQPDAPEEKIIFREFASDLPAVHINVQGPIGTESVEEIRSLLPPVHKTNLEVGFVNNDPTGETENKANSDKEEFYGSRDAVELSERHSLLFFSPEMARAFLAWQQERAAAASQPDLSETFLEKPTGFNYEADSNVPEDNSYLKQTEKNQQVKQHKLKVKRSGPVPNGNRASLAFLSLLFLIKLKLQAQNVNSITKLKKLFLTDSLLLFLLKPTLYLVPVQAVAQADTSCYNKNTYVNTVQ